MWIPLVAIGALVVWAMSKRTGPGREVPAERVRAATLGGYLRALEAAYRATELPTDAIPLAVTHSAMATGAWSDLAAPWHDAGARRTPASAAYMPEKGGPRAFNNNIGVIRLTSGWAGDFARMGTDEVIAGQRVHQAGQAFRAYPSMADSAKDAVRLWKTARYRPAYDLLVTHDPRWSGELGRRGYYTADSGGVRSRVPRSTDEGASDPRGRRVT